MVIAPLFYLCNSMTTKRLILWALMLVTALTVDAAPRTQAQMKEAAAKAINVERKGKKLAPRKCYENTEGYCRVPDHRYGAGRLCRYCC